MRPDFGPHFLIATELDAADGAMSVELDGVDAFAAWDTGAHGLGAEDLGTLYCAVTRRPDGMDILESLEMVFECDEMHGPWLVRLPSKFVTALASIDEIELQTIGERWFQESTEGLQFRETPVEWAQDVALRIAQLARRAIDQGKNLYWEPPSC